ncbi:MAG: hypothetical protein V4723_08660 [Pseudomonadota bacterium]
MTHRTLILMAAALLSACGSKPVQPDWQADAGNALNSYSEAYLKGDSAAAASEYARARLAMSSTGRPDLVAHAELYRCATRTASMEFDGCPGFDALAQDATAAEHAYAAYIAGRLDAANARLLPEQHRAVAQGKPNLAAIADPLSRLVAAGVLMRAGRITPADITVATDTASAQGWRRSLLMWLGVSLKRAQAAGDDAEAARLQRRIALASPA